MARQVVGRFYQGIRDHDYAKWVFDGHKDGTTGVQIALAAIVACAKAMSARQIHDPATPMVQEGLREALAEAYRKGATDVHNYWVNNPGEPPQGDPEFGEAASDYASAALDIFDSLARALSATPAPPVDETDRLRIALADPNAVHVNMLRGGIAKPSIAQIIHIYGEEAIRAALSATPAQEGER